MNTYKVIFISIIFLLFFTSCGGEYTYKIRDDYYLIKNSQNGHYLIKKGSVFYNYKNKGINLEECLKNNSEERCYALGGPTIVEPDIEKMHYNDRYIVGVRKNVRLYGLDPSTANSILPLQKNGYFILDMKTTAIETGLSEKEFFTRLAKFKIKQNKIEEFDDFSNMIKAPFQ